jgi:hypothetical protein
MIFDYPICAEIVPSTIFTVPLANPAIFALFKSIGAGIPDATIPNTASGPIID